MQGSRNKKQKIKINPKLGTWTLNLVPSVRHFPFSTLHNSALPTQSSVLHSQLTTLHSSLFTAHSLPLTPHRPSAPPQPWAPYPLTLYRSCGPYSSQLLFCGSVSPCLEYVQRHCESQVHEIIEMLFLYSNPIFQTVGFSDSVEIGKSLERADSHWREIVTLLMYQ